MKNHLFSVIGVDDNDLKFVHDPISSEPSDTAGPSQSLTPTVICVSEMDFKSHISLKGSHKIPFFIQI